MGKPSTRVHKQGGIQGVEKLLAIQAVADYCTANGLSVDKLSKQIYDVYFDTAMFSAPSGVSSDGLRNDIASQPLPVLIMEGRGDNLIIRQTEHTKKYLAV